MKKQTIKFSKKEMDFMKLNSYKNLLHVRSYEFLITKNIEEAKKKIKDWYYSLPSEIQANKFIKDKIKEVLARRA